MSINDLPQPILEEYNKIMSRFTDEARLEQFNNLRKFAEEKTQYLVTPASTRYHMCCKHGLVLHSMSVTDTFFKISLSSYSKLTLSKITSPNISSVLFSPKVSICLFV